MRRAPKRPAIEQSHATKTRTILMMTPEQAGALAQFLKMERESDPIEFDHSELGKILLALVGGA